MVLGKHSGKAAIQARLGELGYGLDDAQLDIVVKAIKDLADKKKRIHVEDLEAVVLEEIYRIPDKYKLNYLNTVSGNMAMPTAALELSIDGEDQRLADFGVGPIDAVFNSIAKLTGRSPKLVRYSVNAITGGTDALGEVTVRLEEGGYSAVGRGSDPDVIMASARAYLNALNRLAKKEEENICAKL
jgi:2-isopropylmalate synthase